MPTRILRGDCRDVLKSLPSNSIHCVVTSPPYFGLRDYGDGGQIGLEPPPKEFVKTMVEVFREIHRVLRPDEACWVNLGDSYAGGTCERKDNAYTGGLKHEAATDRGVPEGLKKKDLIGIPWRVAFALQEDGWWLRQDIVWHKPNPMPESATDRLTKSHEYIFLLSKSDRYYYDAKAIREPDGGSDHQRNEVVEIHRG
jgi:DNA modification methylase